MDEQATLLAQLTTRLLQTAALEAKEVRLRRSSCSMLALLEGVLRDADPTTRIRVDIQAEPGLVPVEVDAQMIRLALLQLIDNAAKYAGVHSRITIALRQRGGDTEVAVENQGSTIRREERERIFERYYRGADAVRGPAGTGLGLSIVRKTAEAHGGRAWVECEGASTRFFFTVAGVQRTET